MPGKVYISHAFEDDARCRPLLTALDAWGVDYWFSDRPQQESGQSLAQKAQMAMAQSDVFLRICTRFTYRAYWMSLEAGAFLGLQSDDHHQGGTTRRQLVNLILDAAYRREPFDVGAIVLDATDSKQPGWVNELRQVLGLPPLGDTFAVAREIVPPPSGVSRRQALAWGLGGVVALGLAGTGAAVLVSRAQGHGPRATATATPPTSDARLRWSFFASDPTSQSAAGMSATPVVDPSNGVLYVATQDGLVHAFDLSTGARRWSQRAAQLGAAVYRAPALYNGTLYVSAHAAGLSAFDARSGAPQWQVQGDPISGSEPVVVNNQLYVSLWSLGLGITFASVFDLTGKPLFDIFPPNSDAGTAGASAPLIVDNVLYMGATDGYVYALDATKPAPTIWRADVGAARALALHLSAPFHVNSTPAIANGTLFVGSEDSFVYALDVSTGAQIWRYQTGDKIVESSPTVAGNLVYIGSKDGYIYALNAKTGALVWRYQTDSATTKSGDPLKGVRSSPTVDNGVVYVGADAPYIYALDAQNGNLIRKFKIGGETVSAPVVVGNVLYVTALDGYVYAFNLS